MYHSYIEAKPSAITGMNSMPLIGVLAALLVVVMTGLPKLTQKQDLGVMNGCYDGPNHEHILHIAVLSSGTMTLDGKSTSIDKLLHFVTNGMKRDDHGIFAEIDVDHDASYQELVSLMAALEKSGLDDDHIQVLNHYE
jgi:biopolymer transport protein ExbD